MVHDIRQTKAGTQADTSALGSLAGSEAPPPTLWLLGKTGAGKSSLIRRVAGEEAAEVGDGIAPCTRGISTTELPPKKPALRLMDTRGLGEVGYDAAADISNCADVCDAVLIVARLDDPVQVAVADALKEARRRRPAPPVMLALTASDLVDPGRLPASRAAIIAELRLKESETPTVTLALDPDVGWEDSGMPSLLDALANLLPELSSTLAQRNAREVEREGFGALRPMVLRRAGLAAAADGVPLPVIGPLVGGVTVPAIQIVMLRGLARHYDVPWTRARILRLGTALGAGTTARIGLGLLARQAVKLIPIAGQTVGALGAAALSFSVTYALGRVAARFLYGEATGHPPSPDALRAYFFDALAEIAETAEQVQRSEVQVHGKKGSTE